MADEAVEAPEGRMAELEAALQAGDGEQAYAVVRRPVPGTWPERERVRWGAHRDLARILCGGGVP